jgi:hypothetical protein
MYSIESLLVPCRTYDLWVTSWPAPSEQDAVGVFAYIFFRGVETPEDSEDLRALIESGLVRAAIFLRQGELILALELSDEDQARAIQSILAEVIAGRPEFTLVSETGNLAITRAWSVPDLIICISLFASDDVDGPEIARRIVADNHNAAVDVVRRIGDEPRTGALVQVMGRNRPEVMLQLSKAISASKITPALFYFSLTPEEKARRSARRRPTISDPGDSPESRGALPSVRRIAERRGVSFEEAIHAAGQTLDWIDSQVAEGGHFVLIRRRKRYRVSFPR